MWSLNPSPPPQDLETKAILRQCASAHRYLAELKGASQSIPNQGILINTLTFAGSQGSPRLFPGAQDPF
jgi:hypothetical protein